MEQPTTFINLSGGVDSTYYLYRWFKDNPNKTIFIHHCNLFKARRTAEKQATDNILAWFKNNGYTGFKYTETEFTKTGINSILYDIEVIYFMAGCVLKERQYHSIKTILMPRCNEEYESNLLLRLHFNNPKATLSNFKASGNRIANAIQICQTISRRTFNFISPYVDKTKADMIAELPPDLFALTSYCRKPVDNKPCGNCFNCMRVKKAIHENSRNSR